MTDSRPIAKVPETRARSAVRRTRRSQPVRMTTQPQPGTTLRHLIRQLSAEGARRKRLHLVPSQRSLSQAKDLRSKLPKGLQPLAPLQIVRRGGLRLELLGGAAVARDGALHRIGQNEQRPSCKHIQWSEFPSVEQPRKQKDAEANSPGPDDLPQLRNGKIEQLPPYEGESESRGTLLTRGFLYALCKRAGTGLGRALGRSHVLATPFIPTTGRALLLRFPTTSRKFAPAHELLRATRHLPKVCYLSGNYLR